MRQTSLKNPPTPSGLRRVTPLPLPKPLPRELRPAGLEGGARPKSAGGLAASEMLPDHLRRLRNGPQRFQDAPKWHVTQVGTKTPQGGLKTAQEAS